MIKAFIVTAFARALHHGNLLDGIQGSQVSFPPLFSAVQSIFFQETINILVEPHHELLTRLLMLGEFFDFLFVLNPGISLFC